MKDPIRTHWLQDDEIDKLERKRAKKSNEEKEWWDKDGEDGYTSGNNHVEWEWDDTVMGKDEGNDNQSDGNKEEGYGGKGDGGGDDNREESSTKKHVSGDEKKRKLPSRTSGRGKK